ncbi:LOW QUALITY PROTEIN: partner and localizer of BRCA2 [Thamnophis elegans]|uniref:LOW QUALITY PROTEIN: partner and localizer of BRCA2 n=1 Tax=Thamnophis elegans TaxID=35005 RepID=UPI00137653A8|nr:LOW QUALITY PROTEIN: partner and localizer of BRCA2 [Thamnophis elegans]
MEATASAVLTPQQKAQLKEKLAVLKREYNKTFHRLQRAERAAKVKNHIKKTVAEQNRLLGQEEAVKSPAGDISQLSPETPEEGQAGTSCLGSTAEATPVLFKSRPFEGSLPETLGSGRIHQSGRRVLFNSTEPPLARNCSYTSGTAREQRGRLPLGQRGGRAWEGHGGQHERDTDRGSESPALTWPGEPAETSLQAGQAGRGGATPTMSDADSEMGMLVQTGSPGAMPELSSFLPHTRRGSSLQPLSQESFSGREDSAAARASLCARVRNKQKGEEQPGWWGKEDPGSLADSAVTPGAAPGDRTVPDWLKEDLNDGDPSGEKTSVEDGGPSLGVGSPPVEGVTPSKEGLSSCTVVEGLMFPLEYYVRMTRRLSRRQEEVNLEAVMQSQLGKGRKGWRVAHKEQVANPAQPSQEPPKSDDRLSSTPSMAGEPLAPQLSCQRTPGPDAARAGEDFGHLKFKKLNVCPMKPLGIWDAGGSSEGPLSPPGGAPLEEGAASGQTLLSRMRGTPSALSSRVLLLSPALDGGQSLLQTPDFPLVGATPALLEFSPGALGASPSQAAVAVSPDPGRGIGELRSPGPAGIDRKVGGEATGPSEEPQERDKEPPRQSGPAEELQGEAPAATAREGNLKMTSKLKNGSGSCLVDMSAVWWEAADFAELCIVTAEETSISLWRPLDLGQWGMVHTWHFTKLPVLQIVPLSGAHSVVCAVLGRLETAEIRLLFHPSEDGCAKEELLKAGNINAVLGLTDRKLVSSCWSLQGQDVEVFSFSEMGRSHKRGALIPPEETVLAFAHVAGLQEALLGMTAMNCIVLWNLGTGQLLKKIPVEWSFPASVCHKAYSDSGLLFLVFSHPHAKDSQLPENPAFQMVVLNPKTARSSGVMLLPCPPGIQGRSLERDVRGSSAAAVLTSGTIAVWDLFLGQCTALLPPNSGGSWCLVRWSSTDTCLMAGQEDGSVYLYRYTGGSTWLRGPQTWHPAFQETLEPNPSRAVPGTPLKLIIVAL